MESLIEKISQAGIRTNDTEQADITALPHYLGSFGFYHVISKDWEVYLIKGVFKGNIRKAKGEPPFDDKKLNELAQVLADVERCLRHPAELKLAYIDEHFNVTEAKETAQPFISKDCRDSEISAPLTPVEASLGRNAEINDKHLFAKSPFASLFGETFSPFAYSIAEMLTDIFNPLFMSAGIKTQSPSVKLLYGRAYFNVSDVETLITAFGVKPDMFYLNFLPAVFNGLAKHSLDVPELKVLDLKDSELDEALIDIAESTSSLKKEELFSDDFPQLAALCVMAWEMAYIDMYKAFMDVFKMTGKDVSEAMRHIYKTKDGFNLPNGPKAELFDPAFEPVDCEFPEYTVLSVDDMYKTLPSAKRMLTGKGKYGDKIAAAHKALDRLDTVYSACSDLVIKVREILLTVSADLCDKNILTDVNDIFFLEFKEIKSLIDDDFVGNIPFTLNFRKWQNHRHGAMCMPNYLFEKDVEEAPEIVQKQLDKSELQKAIPCATFFHKEIETDNYICKNAFQLSDLKDIKGKDAVIAESASVLSFAARYCAITDTPLCTGARFATLILSGRKIKIDPDKIKF